MANDDGFIESVDELLASDQGVEEIVFLPELKPLPDGTVRKITVKNMSGREKASLDLRQWDPTKPAGDPERFRTRWYQEDRPFELVAASCYDSHGKRMFTREQSRQLKDLNPKSFARLFAAAQRVNGDDPNDLKLSGKAGEIPQSGDSLSESPTPITTEASPVLLRD